jgi:hypothetical protein
MLCVSQVFISLNAFCWSCLLTEPHSPVQGMEEPLYPRRLTGRKCWWRHCSRGRKILKTIKNSGRAVSSCLGDRSPPCEHRFIALARGSARALFAHECKLRAGAILDKTTKYGRVGDGYKFFLIKRTFVRMIYALMCVYRISWKLFFRSFGTFPWIL